MPITPTIDATFVATHCAHPHTAGEITTLNAALTAHHNDTLDTYLATLPKPQVQALYAIAGDIDLALDFDYDAYDEDFLTDIAEITVIAAAQMH